MYTILIMKSKFIINDVKMINTWCYNLSSNNDCTICRCNLNSKSIYAEEKNIDSTVVTGICGHSFHLECVNPWNKNNTNCPICPNKWIITKNYS